MKARDQMSMGDGFDRSVAEKMPTVKRTEETLPPPEPERLERKEEPVEVKQDSPVPPKAAEKRSPFQSFPKEAEPEPHRDVMRLIEDLHTQLLASGRTKSALEMDLASSQKSLHRLAQDNQDLRGQLDQMSRELQRVREGQTETAYLREENEDALERIRNFQQEVRGLREALARMTQEKEEALSRVRQMESEEQQSELLRIKERLKEREASHFSRENQELQARLETVMAENAELEGKYEALRKSFKEVKESLAVLRDTYKASYYNRNEVLD